jgi:hypothetical protein
MIFSENRFPLFGIMLCPASAPSPAGARRPKIWLNRRHFQEGTNIELIRRPSLFGDPDGERRTSGRARFGPKPEWAHGDYAIDVDDTRARRSVFDCTTRGK